MSSGDHDRLKRLSGQIDAMRADESATATKARNAEADAANMGNGARAGAELITCIIAGGLIGWGLDSAFDTKPWFLIVFLLTGVCTGFYEVYRITNNMGRAVGYRPAPEPPEKP